jgi:hypothetical protein
MPLDHAWLFTRGQAPQEVQKYQLEAHPLYQPVPEKGKRQELTPAAEHEA